MSGGQELDEFVQSLVGMVTTKTRSCSIAAHASTATYRYDADRERHVFTTADGEDITFTGQSPAGVWLLTP